MAQRFGGSFGPLFYWTQHDYDLLMASLTQINVQQRQTQATINQLLKQEKILMSALDDLTEQVRQNTNVEQSAVTLIQGIAQKLQDAVSNNDSAALQQLAGQLSSSSAALAAAIAANTPSEGEGGGGGDEPHLESRRRR
jgi:alanyl-tRNA synthetase